MRTLWTKLNAAIERFKDSLTEAQWDVLRAVVALAILAAVGGGSIWVGYPLWRRWQNRAALAQANGFAQRKDYRSMFLALRRATELEPADFTTWRTVERLLAEIGSPETLVADEQLSRLAPQDMSLRLALVQDALHFGQFETAEAQLAQLDAAAQRDIAFHRLAAGLAAATGRTDEFKAQVAAIVAAEPNNLNAQFTYASLRLWGADPAQVAAARAELDRLLAEPTVRVRAAIELLTAAARQRDPALMQRLLVRLLGVFAPGTRPDFSVPEPPAWTALLDGMGKAAAGVPSDAALMMRWLADMGRPAEALAWLARLPPASRNASIVLDVAAELEAAGGRLGAFDGLLRRGAWGLVPDNAVTLALAAHLERTRYDPARGRATWIDAIAACGDSISGLRALARMAQIWHETDGADRALQAVLDRAPESLWAYQALRNDYVARRDLPDLYQLYGRWTRVMPDDRIVAAEWILTGCIIGQASPQAYTRAEELRRDAPGSLLATLADVAALWRQGEPEKAWTLLNALPAAERSQPEISFWSALVGADLGRAAETALALARAYRPDMSDAERSLLRTAAGKVGVALPNSDPTNN